MKRFRLLSFCALLMCASLLFACCTAAAEETPAAEAPQPATQIYVVPRITKELKNTDGNQLLVNALRALMQLLPRDGSAEVVLFPAKGDANTVYSGDRLSDPLAGLDIPYDIEEPSVFLQGLSAAPADSQKRIVIVLESRKVTKEASLENSWSELRTLAENGTDVYIIGLQTKDNTPTSKAFAKWLGGGESLTLPANAMTDVSDRLHYLWLEDYTRILPALGSLVNELTGYAFTPALPVEDGAYVMHPFPAVTSGSLLMLEGNAQGLIVTNGAGIRTSAETVASKGTVTVVRVPSDADTLRISSGDPLSSVLWCPLYNDLADIRLEFGAGDGRTNFKRNEQAVFAARLQNADTAALAGSMAYNGLTCDLIDAETGKTIVSMPFDAEAGRFETHYTFRTSGKEMQVGARIRLDDEHEIVSQTCSVNVANSAPVITAAGESIYWIGDPWAETDQTHISIPLTVSDDEGDKVSVSIKELQMGAINGLGTVSVSKDNASLDIELNSKPDTAKLFAINLIANDGESDSEPCAVAFTLYDLSEEIAKLGASAVITLEGDAEVPKRTDFTVSASVSFPGLEELPETLRTELTAKIADHCGCVLTGDSSEAPTAMAKADEKWQYTCRIDEPGTHTYRAVYTIDSDPEKPVKLESDPLTVAIIGRTPTLKKQDFPAAYDEMLTAPEGQSEESWQLSGLSASNLFSDADGDEITITARAVPEGEGTILEASAAGNQPASLRFTVPGTYKLTIRSSDADGEGDVIESSIRLTSTRAKLILTILIAAAALAVLIALICLIVYLCKPTFTGKVIGITLGSAKWTQKSTVCPDVWKKKKQPLGLLLTCAACAPDRDLYTVIDGVCIKPAKQGAVLTGAQKLGAGKKVRIAEGETASFSIGSYKLEITVSTQK